MVDEETQLNTLYRINNLLDYRVMEEGTLITR